MRLCLAKAIPMMNEEPDYTEQLRRTKSLLVVSTLQQRLDLKARKLVEKFRESLSFEPLKDFMIEESAWAYVTGARIRPQLVFCHPRMLIAHPVTSLYYRGMSGLSMKAAKEYFGAIEKLESGSPTAKLSSEKALTMARTYNLFLSSIMVNSVRWTLENGRRTILATMGITIDGMMRNKVGEIGEERVRRLVVEWLVSQDLVIAPPLKLESLPLTLPRRIELRGDVLMKFSSEPDISFEQGGELKATVEVKGGIDPAGALERYGAAKKSFEHAVKQSSRCRNFYLGGVLTEELRRRINSDRLVERTYDVISLLTKAEVRDDFLRELFHHTLRLI